MPIRNEYRKETVASIFDNTAADRDWLNPIAMSHLKAAVDKGEDLVILNGKEFAITYNVNNGQSIRLNPTDGSLVPMGYIGRDRIRNFGFEDKA